MIESFDSNGYVIIHNSQLSLQIFKLKKYFEYEILSRFTNVVVNDRNLIKRMADNIQLIHLYSNQYMIDIYGKLGIELPIFSGPCVTHYTSNNIIGQSFGLPYHQDFPSMASSVNSIIIWFNLFNSNPDTHSIEVVPGSHKFGLQEGQHTANGFVSTKKYFSNSKILTLECGDILIMSTFLLHRTYVNKSCQMDKMSISRRIDDLNCKSWKKNNFANAYYTSVDRKLFESYKF